VTEILTAADQRQTAGTILQVATALIGLLLVFAGLVIAKAEQLANVKRGQQILHVARGCALPLIPAFVCSWLCVNVLQGDASAYQLVVITFRVSLIATAWYAFVVLFFYL
jgi:hypothetical protein